jgi:hypothetical protein
LHRSREGVWRNGRAGARHPRLAVVTVLLACAATLVAPLTALADEPWPKAPSPSGIYAYENYLRAHVVCPNATGSQNPTDYDCNDYKTSSVRDPNAGPPLLQDNAQELGGVLGSSMDKAFNVSTGRPDVHIAVLDSGIMWDDGNAMKDLRGKVWLNWAELPPPEQADGSLYPGCTPGSLPSRSRKLPSPGFPTIAGGSTDCYDVNHDGVFNTYDYALDPRVNGAAHPYFCCKSTTAANNFLTPEDLIEVFSCYDATQAGAQQFGALSQDAMGRRVCSNGAALADNDGNGFPHDIAGWNFMERTNDPFDEPHYGHGTGEARDSNAEANNGGDIGTCPSCMVLPLKVGDSFIADVNEFSQAVMYATDNNANIVQEALGTLNRSDLTQGAIDYAYRNGVVVMASAADEEAGHHNQPGSTENHTVDVNSVTHSEVDTSTATGQLQLKNLPAVGRTQLLLNGCTNYGGHTIVTIESGSCSSEAVGKASGYAGLLYSEARNLVKKGLMAQYAAPTALHPDGIDISPNEVKQVLAATADNIDFEDASPPVTRGDSPTDATSACANVPLGLPGTPDGPGLPNNYGTTNVGERYRSIAGWSQYFGYGRANTNCAVRTVLRGAIPPEAEIDSPEWWANLDTTDRTSFPVIGRVAASRVPGGRYSYKVQLAYGVQPHEADFKDVPVAQPGTHTSPISGTLATLTKAQVEAAFAAYNPVTYALTHPLADPNGDQTDWYNPASPYSAGLGKNQWDQYTFTLRVQVTPLNPSGQPLAGVHIGEDRRSLQSHHDDSSGANGTEVAGFPKKYGTDGDSEPVMADLLGDNQKELLFGTSSGLIHALRGDGTELPGWPVHTTPVCDSALPDSSVCPSRQREPAFQDPVLGPVAAAAYAGIFRGVAVGDLDRTGRLEVVTTDAAGYVYVYEPSAAYCAGIGQAAPCVKPGFPTHVDFRYSRQGLPGAFNRDHDNRVQFGFFSSPALADLNNDGKLEIVTGSLDRHLYVWKPDGSLQPGFPLMLAAPEKLQSVAPVTHKVKLKSDAGAFYGSKIVSPPSVGDLLGDGHKEIVVGRNEEYALSADGGYNASADSGGVIAAPVAALVSSANGRTYAVFSDGYCHGLAACPAQPPDVVPTRAYVPGWPVKVAIIDAEILPTVGSGVDTPPALIKMSCPQNSSPGLKVAVSTNNGPVYVFGSDGKSCYGQGMGTDGLSHDRTVGGFGTIGTGNNTDPVATAAFGNIALGDLSGKGDMVVVTATAGVGKLVDVVAAAHQFNAMNQIAAWSLSGVLPGCAAADCAPQFHAGYPHYMNDLQFLAGPAIADITGDGSQAVLMGSATNDFRGIDQNGNEVPGWNKNTGDWMTGTAAVDTLGTARTKRVAILTRDGRLYVWNTTAGQCAGASWPKARHDAWNSGEYETRAGRPSTISDLAGTRSGGSVKLTFTAPHGDLFCGNAQGYEVRYSTTGPITDANWSQASLVNGSSVTLSGAAGTAGAGNACQAQAAAVSVPANGPVWVAVQGVNDATRKGGNLGAISNTAYFPGTSSSSSAGTTTVNNACVGSEGLPNTSRAGDALDLTAMLVPAALVATLRRRRRRA